MQNLSARTPIIPDDDDYTPLKFILRNSSVLRGAVSYNYTLIPSFTVRYRIAKNPHLFIRSYSLIRSSTCQRRLKCIKNTKTKQAKAIMPRLIKMENRFHRDFKHQLVHRVQVT